MLVYRGSSMLNGSLILGIITDGSENRKTGDVSQLWILDGRMDPVQAIRNNADGSVCGDCKHRGTSCYVVAGRGPLAIYNAYLRGKYGVASNLNFLEGKTVRLGAYGEPAALPLELVRNIALTSDGWAGYTHQWKRSEFQGFRPYLMASVDSLSEYVQAREMGWKTFRVKNAGEAKLGCELVCPATLGKTTCEKCRLCSGTSSRTPKDIVVDVHGLDWKKKRFALQMV